jgi:hypothetical protein
VRLVKGYLHVEMKDHFATETDAVLEVAPYLRSWEIATALQHGPGVMTFVFENAEIIDRDPPPPGTPITGTAHGRFARLTGSAVGVVPLLGYPVPPDAFKASADVVSMWERYADFTAGKDRLTNVAWWCYTTIEQSSGGPQRAATKYAISHNVLETLSRLAHGGDERTARKRFANQTFCPHTPAELAWMEATVKRLIQRAGEWRDDPDAQWPQITMEDLPKL